MSLWASKFNEFVDEEPNTRGTPKVLQLNITNQFLWINIFSTRKLHWFKLLVQIWVQFTGRFTQYGYLNQTGWLLEQSRLLIWYCFKRWLTPSAAFDETQSIFRGASTILCSRFNSISAFEIHEDSVRRGFEWFGTWFGPIKNSFRNPSIKTEWEKLTWTRSESIILSNQRKYRAFSEVNRHPLFKYNFKFQYLKKIYFTKLAF